MAEKKVLTSKERVAKTRAKEKCETATTLYETTEAPVSGTTYSEMRVRMETLAGFLSDHVCAFFCQVVAEREADRKNFDSFVKVLMPRHPRGQELPQRSERLVDVDDPQMHLWCPPEDFDDHGVPEESSTVLVGSPADIEQKKQVAYYNFGRTFSDRIVSVWSCNSILGLLEKNLGEYIELAGKWLAAWDVSEDAVPQSVETGLSDLHTFMIAVVAVGSASVFTPSTWVAFQRIFRTTKKKGSTKITSAVEDMVYILKQNWEWVDAETEAVRAANFELHGSPEALEATKTPESEFSNDFLTRIAENWNVYKESVRSSVWNPFEMKMYQWVCAVVAAAEAGKMSDVDWQPPWQGVLQCMADSASCPDVATGAVDLRSRVDVISSTACARFMLEAIHGWATKGANWEIYKGEGLDAACSRVVGHEDLAEEMGGVADLQTVGARAVVAYKEKLEEMESLDMYEELKQAGVNILRIASLVDEVVAEAFVDFVNGLSSLITAAVTVAAVSDGAKPAKKGATEKLKKCFDSFAALAKEEAHAQYFTAFSKSPAFAVISEKMNEVLASVASTARASLEKVVVEAEPIAGGGPAGESWKANLVPNAKLKDVIHHVADPANVFMSEGDARSKIFDKVDKAPLAAFFPPHVVMWWLRFRIMCVCVVCRCRSCDFQFLEAMNVYVSELKKWGCDTDSAFLERAKLCAELARATTLEGHYIRCLNKKDAQEKADGLLKYSQKYAAVAPNKIHPTLQQEVAKANKKK